MKKSFTLIETIVVIAVIGLTLPVLFALIFTLMRQQIKIYRLSQVKKEGDYLLSTMGNTIRDNAMTIHQANPPSDANIVCNDLVTSPIYPTGGGTIGNLYFLDTNNNLFGYRLTGTKIASDSASPTVHSVDLTSSKIVVYDFSIACAKNADYSTPYVSISFNICYQTTSANCVTSRPEEKASIHYQTRIKLRNY